VVADDSGDDDRTTDCEGEEFVDIVNLVHESEMDNDEMEANTDYNATPGGLPDELEFLEDPGQDLLSVSVDDQKKLAKSMRPKQNKKCKKRKAKKTKKTKKTKTTKKGMDTTGKTGKTGKGKGKGTVCMKAKDSGKADSVDDSSGSSASTGIAHDKTTLLRWLSIFDSSTHDVFSFMPLCFYPKSQARGRWS